MFVVMDIKAAGWQCSGAGAARRSEKKARSGEEDGAFWPASLVMHMHQPPATTDNDEQRGDSPQQNYRHCFLLRRPGADSTGAESKRSSSLRVDINH